MRFVQLASVVLCGLGVLACTTEEESRALPPGPGTQPWVSDDVACATDADCASGEFCGPGAVCQMQRCAGAYDSLQPLGLNHYFGTDGEFAIISDSSYVDAFESSGSYLSSWDLDGEAVRDVTGGSFDGQRPHGIAVAVEYSDHLLLRQGNQVSELPVGIWPKAIASGDTDADGLAEIVSFAEDGTISVCHVETGQCQGATIAGAVGQDVAVADVDADGFHEPLFLFEYSDRTEIVIWNLDAAVTGQEESYGWQFDFGIEAIAAGDLDGDLTAEVLCLEDGGWFGLANDTLHVFAPASGTFLTSVDIQGHSRDVAVGDADSDDRAEVVVLREDNRFELFRSAQPIALSSAGLFDYTVGTEAQRISMLDWDGDSASVRYLSGPDLVAGLEVPTMVMLFPPYPHGVTNPPLDASVSVGNAESTSESWSDSVSLGVGLAVSFGADLGPIVKAKVGASFNQDVSVTRRISKSFSIGARYSIDAQPDLYGTDYGGLLLACGCYHRYGYQTEDPANKIGGSGKLMDIYVPVGGQTLLLSTKRYNAMAKQVPHLPVIEPAVRIGDVASYPAEPTRLDGSPVPAGDLLFPEIPSFNASDVGHVTFWLSAGESETNEVCESTTIGINGSIGGGGLSIDGSVSFGVSQGYSVNVGQEATFSGTIPPIPDDPDTPEDEFALHYYSFRPVVYREHYQTPTGEDAGYYVLGYAVGQ